MKTKIPRRRFIRVAAVTAAVGTIPVLGSSAAVAATSESAVKAEGLPKRRLGRTNRMVSCIGFGGGSRYTNWIAPDEILQKHIDHAIKLGITYFDCNDAQVPFNGQWNQVILISVRPGSINHTHYRIDIKFPERFLRCLVPFVK